MKKGNVITAIDSMDRATDKLKDILLAATDDDLIHAAQYAYTDGGKIKGDSQQPRLKTLRTMLIRYRELTVKREKGVWVVQKPTGRATQQPKGEGKTKTGNRSKPSKTLSKAEEKAAEMVADKEPADKVAAIARQMERLGVSLSDLETYFAERDAQADEKVAA